MRKEYPVKKLILSLIAGLRSPAGMHFLRGDGSYTDMNAKTRGGAFEDDGQLIVAVCGCKRRCIMWGEKNGDFAVC